MNITDLLREDHRLAENLIAQLEGGADHETFGKLKNALTIHTQIEEDIFYPALEEFDETEDLIDEAYEEHNDVDALLEEMGATEIPSDDFEDLLVQLKDAINHHVEEEENQIFPLSERLLGENTLEEMGNSAEKIKGKYELSHAQTS
jgi:hemerythrin superfamily protein